MVFVIKTSKMSVMKTSPFPDFLGPLPRGRIIRMGDLNQNDDTSSNFFRNSPSQQSAVESPAGVDRSDYPCYVIMGLAILISILIPLLNWS